MRDIDWEEFFWAMFMVLIALIIGIGLFILFIKFPLVMFLILLVVGVIFAATFPVYFFGRKRDWWG